ncbi:SspB family protein [Tropicimonas marinistellae]|uniref:SspB family protein n=1 Tax=Tropicimonas marinistellae TaxID=1739787 RepID=UPI00083586DD|nr:ClpXP protease specificity-enhancing factor SspB [Tropicimonas marinistellae]
MSQSIDYGKLMHRAMRSLIQEVLGEVARSGLPGQHHFFITFDTTHPDVNIADWLRDRYPQEMTVVLQHWFDNLDVTDDGFAVTLNFGETPEPLYIPYDSIATFVDPSVEFGLRFETASAADDDEAPEDDDRGTPEPTDEAPIAEDIQPDEPQGDAEVVRLDSFRK